MASRTFSPDYGIRYYQRSLTSNPREDFHDSTELLGAVTYGTWNSSTLNKPSDSSSFGGFWIEVSTSANYGLILAAQINANKIWIKQRINGTYQNWKSVTLS